MHYRSVADLNDDIISGLPLLPPDVDLVIGIPRSGLLAGTLLALALNVPATDVEGFLAGRILSTGRTRRRELFDSDPRRARRVLVVDDSADTGQSVRDARARLTSEHPGVAFSFCVVYGTAPECDGVDITLKVVPQPRLFQWNVMHHNMLARCCVDIDGVLCSDPSDDENDDGERYLKFLLNAPPFHTPTRRIGWLVTSRLEKYRKETEAWLAKRGIEYGELHMLDLPSREARLKAGSHGSFKAEVYSRTTGALLFIESEREQAREICRLAGKPVLSLGSQELFTPEPLSPLALAQRVRTLPARYRAEPGSPTSLARQVVGSALRSTVSPKVYDALRTLSRRGQARPGGRA
ncbi:phosphoribosyltransferase family protein [Hyphomicrobium sp. CS1GBMeth3]|uniref:phosphoribosyltransferase family protein n=1 Tax=Hyphomicrobium sp. CS1GBMeth3 TaxID=1892845 RepID=UPI0009303CC0|nr:phosphoribosyltransferase family protein [Hyphomicrobium sp. CS1GBMeth3]